MKRGQRSGDTLGEAEQAANAATSTYRDLSALREAVEQMIVEANSEGVARESLLTRGFIRRRWERLNPNRRMDDLVMIVSRGERIRLKDEFKISEWIDDLISYILRSTKDPETGQRKMVKIGHWRMAGDVIHEVDELVKSDNATDMTAFIQDVDEQVQLKVAQAASIFKSIQDLMIGREQIAIQAREHFALALDPVDVKEIVDRVFPDDGIIGVQLRQLRLTGEFKEEE